LLSPEKTSERTIPTKPANFNPQHRRQQDRARMILRAIDALLNKKDAKQGEGL